MSMENDKPRLGPGEYIFLAFMFVMWCLLVALSLRMMELLILTLAITPFGAYGCWQLVKEGAELSYKLRKMKE